MTISASLCAVNTVSGVGLPVRLAENQSGTNDFV